MPANADKTRRKRRTTTASTDPVTDMHQRLQELGYITSDRALVAECYALHMRSLMTTKSVPALLLQGPPGTGKTFLAETMTRYYQVAEPIIFQFTPGVTKEELMYDLNIPNIVRAQSNKWVGEFMAEHTVLPGIFVEALVRSRNERVILLLDEIDKASEKVDAFLLDYLQSCRMRAGPMGMLHGNPRNLLVFITMNNQRQISEPLMRRCLRHELDWPVPAVEEQMILSLAQRHLAQLDRPPYPDLQIQMKAQAPVLVSLANEVRKLAPQLKKVPSSPELADALVDLAMLPTTADWGAKVYKTLLAYPEDRKLATGIWRKQPAELSRTLVSAVDRARQERDKQRALRKQAASGGEGAKSALMDNLTAATQEAKEPVKIEPGKYYHQVAGGESLEVLKHLVKEGVLIRGLSTPCASDLEAWAKETGLPNIPRMFRRTSKGWDAYRTDLMNYEDALMAAVPLPAECMPSSVTPTVTIGPGQIYVSTTAP